VSYKVIDSSDVRIDFKCSKEGNPQFTKMFDFLETNKAKYHIATYGFGDTNLEDVFLEVSKINEHHNENNDIQFEVAYEHVEGFTKIF